MANFHLFPNKFNFASIVIKIKKICINCKYVKAIKKRKLLEMLVWFVIWLISCYGLLSGECRHNFGLQWQQLLLLKLVDQMGMIVKFVFACLYFALEVIEPYNLVFFFQKLLRGVGLFAGSIFLMRNFGELMAIWRLLRHYVPHRQYFLFCSSFWC